MVCKEAVDKGETRDVGSTMWECGGGRRHGTRGGGEGGDGGAASGGRACKSVISTCSDLAGVPSPGAISRTSGDAPCAGSGKSAAVQARGDASGLMVGTIVKGTETRRPRSPIPKDGSSARSGTGGRAGGDEFITTGDERRGGGMCWTRRAGPRACRGRQREVTPRGKVGTGSGGGGVASHSIQIPQRGPRSPNTLVIRLRTPLPGGPSQSRRSRPQPRRGKSSCERRCSIINSRHALSDRSNES